MWFSWDHESDLFKSNVWSTVGVGGMTRNIISQHEQFYYDNGTKRQFIWLQITYLQMKGMKGIYFFIWTLKDTNQIIWLFKTRVTNKSKTNIIKLIGLALNSFSFLWTTCSSHYTHICEHTEALAWYDPCSLTTKLLQTEMLCCRCYCMLHIYSYSVLSLNLEAMYAMSKHVSKCT